MPITCTVCLKLRDAPMCDRLVICTPAIRPTQAVTARSGMRCTNGQSATSITHSAASLTLREFRRRRLRASPRSEHADDKS